MKAILSAKGQITIPKPLREHLGLRAGQILELQEEQGKLVATKSASVDAVDGVFGILNATQTTHQIMNVLRGEADSR